MWIASVGKHVHSHVHIHIHARSRTRLSSHDLHDSHIRTYHCTCFYFTCHMLTCVHREPSVSVPAAIAHANAGMISVFSDDYVGRLCACICMTSVHLLCVAVAAPVSASVSIGQTNAANSNPNQLGGVITRLKMCAGTTRDFFSPQSFIVSCMCLCYQMSAGMM